MAQCMFPSAFDTNTLRLSAPKSVPPPPFPNHFCLQCSHSAIYSFILESSLTYTPYFPFTCNLLPGSFRSTSRMYLNDIFFIPPPWWHSLSELLLAFGHTGVMQPSCSFPSHSPQLSQKNTSWYNALMSAWKPELLLINLEWDLEDTSHSLKSHGRSDKVTNKSKGG